MNGRRVDLSCWRRAGSPERFRTGSFAVPKMMRNSECIPAVVAVVAAVITNGDRILACRRNAEREAGGLWEFPGGKVKPGESAQHALVREIREELGVGIRVGDLLHRGSTPMNGRLVELACYWATLTDAEPSSSTDHDSIRWFRRDALHGVEWPEPDQAAVALLADGARPRGTVAG